jgi:hypothetical protein
MDARRIKELLHAWRPGQDLPPEAAQAREIASGDQDISEWLDNERAFDQAFSDKLRGVRPPSDLLDRIMAAHESGEANVVPFAPEPPALARAAGNAWRYAVSIAASFVIVAGIFAFTLRESRGGYDDLQRFVDDTTQAAMAGQMSEALGMDSVRQGLQAVMAPIPSVLPTELTALEPSRYGVIQTREGNIGQIGFSGDDSYRLIVMERRCVGGCSKKLGKPIMYDMGEQLAVAWAKGNQVFILIGNRSGENMIRDIASSSSTSL